MIYSTANADKIMKLCVVYFYDIKCMYIYVVIHTYYICLDFTVDTILWITRVYFVQINFVLFFNMPGQKQNVRHFADDILKYTSVNEHCWMFNQIALTFFLKFQIAIWYCWIELWLSSRQEKKHYLN